jgi:hypothetical protein
MKIARGRDANAEPLGLRARTATEAATMREHTPGPWTIDNVRHDRASGITTMDVRGPGRPRGPSERPYRDVIAEVRTDWGTRDEVKANGYLIAAAPELLDALGLALATFHDTDRPSGIATIDAMRAAIAKASGQS